MNTINKLLTLTLIFMMIACQKSKQSFPLQMQKAEKLVISKPTTALQLLDSIKSKINNQPTETQRYYDLLMFRANDMCYIPHPSNDTIQRCITYYTKNFNNDKLMTAYYCLGCFYRDKKNYVEASKSYQKALNYVSQSKDFSLIGRVYDQLANLSDIPKYRISMYKKSAIYFAKAKDNRALMYSLRDIASSFDGEELNNSAVCYGEKACKIAQFLKDKRSVEVMHCQLANYYLKVNKIDQARHLLNKTLLNINNNNDVSLCYWDWGEYYDKVKNNDSAKWYYNKCLQTTNDINFKYSSYKALYDIYKKENDSKKAVVCADSLLNLDNEDQLLTHDSEVTKQNISFGVKRVEKENNKLSKIVESRNLFIAGLIIIFVLSSIIVLRTIKKKEILRQEKFKKKIKDEMSKTNEAAINEKIKQINDLRNEIERLKIELELLPKMDELMVIKKRNEVLIKDFLASHAYSLVYNKIQNKEPLTDNQWSELQKAIDNTYDNFNVHLKALYQDISEQETRICNLKKAGFNAEQMAIAMSCTKSNTYNVRARLYKKMTAKSGSSNDMDKLISEL